MTIDLIPTTPSRTVRGRLTDDVGRPAAGVAVRGIARESGHESTLGEGVTADDGSYELAHEPLPRGTALAVRAIHPSGHVLGESTPRFAVADGDTIDLVVARDGAVEVLRIADPEFSFAPTATVAAAGTTIGAHVSERLNAHLRAEVTAAIGATQPDLDRAVASVLAAMSPSTRCGTSPWR